MHGEYRTMIYGAVIGAAVLAAISLQAMEARDKATIIKHTDGVPALITPECQPWQRCQQAAEHSCPRGFFQALAWREIRADTPPEGDAASSMRYRLIFRCYPSATSVVVELIDGKEGLKLGPCISEEECKDFAATMCPTGYFERESKQNRREYPPSLKRAPIIEAFYSFIRCESALEDAAE